VGEIRKLCWVLRQLRAARARLMNGADRKAVKSELKAALRTKALGMRPSSRGTNASASG
jgi:hypothetical protein